MSNKRLAPIIVIVLVVGGLLFRYLQLLPYPKGNYNWVESPDERHRAYISVLVDKGFFGGTRAIYELRVEMGRATGKRMEIYNETVDRDEVLADVDLHNLGAVIDWSPDSQKVTFTLGGRDFEVLIPFG